MQDRGSSIVLFALKEWTCWIARKNSISTDFWPGLERASEGAQLDGEFAFYASRCLLRAWPGGGWPHSWTEIFLSTSLAADFGTGPEAGHRGVQLDEEFCFTPLSTDFWPGQDGAAGGGEGGRGVCFSCFSTLLATNFEPGLDGAVGCAAVAWSLPFYLSITGLSTGGQAMLCHWSQPQDCKTDPPPLMRWGTLKAWRFFVW